MTSHTFPCPWLALAVLLYAPGASSAPPPPPAPPAAATATTAQGPDADFAQQMPELMRIVEEYRGLRFAHPVPLHTLSAAELGEKLAAGGKTGPGSILGDVRPLEIGLKAFGLIPQSMGRQSTVSSFVKLDGRVIEAGGTGGRRAYELRCRFTRKGVEIERLQRLYERGTLAMSVAVEARADRWSEIEPSARELLAGVAIEPPASGVQVGAPHPRR